MKQGCITDLGLRCQRAWLPGKSSKALPSTSYPKTPYTKGHMQKATSKGNILLKACANCNLFLCSCNRQPGTACVCKSCSHRFSNVM